MCADRDTSGREHGDREADGVATVFGREIGQHPTARVYRAVKGADLGERDDAATRGDIGNEGFGAAGVVHGNDLVADEVLAAGGIFDAPREAQAGLLDRGGSNERRGIGGVGGQLSAALIAQVAAGLPGVSQRDALAGRQVDPVGKLDGNGVLTDDLAAAIIDDGGDRVQAVAIVAKRIRGVGGRIAGLGVPDKDRGALARREGLSSDETAVNTDRDVAAFWELTQLDGDRFADDSFVIRHRDLNRAGRGDRRRGSRGLLGQNSPRSQCAGESEKSERRCRWVTHDDSGPRLRSDRV